MLVMLLVLLVSLVLAGGVALYVAFPRRGEEVPHAPWLGEAMKRGVESLPTLGNQLGESVHGGLEGRGRPPEHT